MTIPWEQVSGIVPSARRDELAAVERAWQADDGIHATLSPAVRQYVFGPTTTGGRGARCAISVDEHGLQIHLDGDERSLAWVHRVVTQLIEQGIVLRLLDDSAEDVTASFLQAEPS